MREEELLKLVIAVYGAAFAHLPATAAQRAGDVSFGDNAARKHPVTRYRMSRAR